MKFGEIKNSPSSFFWLFKIFCLNYRCSSALCRRKKYVDKITERFDVVFAVAMNCASSCLVKVVTRERWSTQAKELLSTVFAFHGGEGGGGGGVVGRRREEGAEYE